MTDTLRADPFSSVYVLDAHFQQQNAAAVNVFNSAAGRAIVCDSPPTDRRSPSFKPSRRQGADVTKFLLNNGNHDPSRYDNGNSFIKNNNYEEKIWIFEEDECRGLIEGAVPDYRDCSFVPPRGFESIGRPYLDEETVERQSFEPKDDGLTDENRNITPKGRLTRRLVTAKEERPVSSDVCITIYEDEKPTDRAGVDDDDDARIDEKILRLKNHYERGFVADEKCDILKRMLTGFLSGIVFTKSSTRISKWKKRKSSNDLYREASYVLGIPCEMTDSCRCLDCQCNYFDCGDSVSISSDASETEAEVEAEASCSGSGSASGSEEEGGAGAGAGAEAPGAAPPTPPTSPAPEMAAGTPVLLDHLLNTPLSCSIQ